MSFSASARSLFAIAMPDFSPHASAFFGSIARIAFACSRLFSILMAGKEYLAEVQTRLDILRIEIDRAPQFRIGSHDRSRLQIGFGELEVRVSVVRIDLDRVRELNDRFLLLALRRVGLSAVQVFDLADVGVARASLREQGQNRRDKPEPVHGPSGESASVVITSSFPKPRQAGDSVKRRTNREQTTIAKRASRSRKGPRATRAELKKLHRHDQFGMKRGSSGVN